MRSLVDGAGSTGGYFGGRLAQIGRDVTFLVRPRRAAQLQETGLQIVSPHGDAKLTPKVVTADKLDGPYDAVLVTVKAYSLEAALDDFAPAVGPQTAILPTLNGMKHVDILTARFGKDAVAGCVCKIAATIDAQNRIAQLAQFQELVYGEMDGSPSPRMQALDAFMQGANFDARLSPTVKREMWEKWVLLATMGGITCLKRGNIGEIAAAHGGDDFVRHFLDEVVTTVRKVGEAPSENFLKAATATLTMKGSTMASSMYRDMQGGHAIEADQIVGDLLARAQRAGLATPLLAAAYTHMCIYQNRRAAA
jgi:2-dehydropantoate 2-reductase